MKKTPASQIAFGGMMAALALVIMNMVGLIPIATYVCPCLCMVLLSVVLKLCGKRIGWAWYGAVAILSLLLSPDKEAAAVFTCLGYYPILKPWFDRLRFSLLPKLVFFNAVILAMYWVLLRIIGMGQIAAEFAEMGTILTAVMLVMGNVIFWMLDFALTRFARKH